MQTSKLAVVLRTLSCVVVALGVLVLPPIASGDFVAGVAQLQAALTVALATAIIVVTLLGLALIDEAHEAARLRDSGKLGAGRRGVPAATVAVGQGCPPSQSRP